MDDTYMARQKTCLKDFKSGELENRAFMDVKNQMSLCFEYLEFCLGWSQIQDDITNHLFVQKNGVNGKTLQTII